MSFADKLLSFHGRIGRGDWWMLNILIFVVCVVGWVIAFAVFAPSGQPVSVNEVGKPVSDPGDFGAFLLALLAPGIVTLWPSLAIQVKRWHDRDKGAAWLLINFIPYVGPIWAFVELGFLPGTPGPNRFGAGPGQGAGTVADVFGDEEAYSGADAAIARWQAEQTMTAARPGAWTPSSAATGGFGRRGLSPAR